jgi:hypothetical protein
MAIIRRTFWTERNIIEINFNRGEIMNWEIFLLGMVGIIIHVLTAPQTDSFNLVVSWIKNHTVSVVVSGLLWTVTAYAWSKGGLVSYGLELPSATNPMIIEPVIVAYVIKSIWGHVQNMFTGKLGLKTNG